MTPKNQEWMKANRAEVCRWGAAAVFCLLALCGACARSPQALRDRAMASGRRLMDQRDYRRALLEFKNAVQAMPRDAEAQYQLGNANAALGDVASAAAAYRRATELDPKHADAQRRLAELMTVLGDRNLVEEAERRLHVLLDSSPSDMTALNTLAFAELKLGKREEAIRHLEDVLTKSPERMASAVLLAEAKLAEKDVAGAEEVLKRSCAQNPDSPEAWVVLGRFYSGTGNLAAAEQQFEAALRIQPKNAPALFFLGVMQNAEGRKTEAEERFKALSVHPEKVYWPVYGMFLFQEGRKEEAIREFERLNQEDPDDRTARTRLIATYQAVNRLSDADKLITEALRRNPKDLSALLQRSMLRLENGNRQGAQVDLNQVLHEDRFMAEAHYVQAKIYEKNGLSWNQRQELSEALRLKPLFLPARIELAQLLTNSGAGTTALHLLDETPAEQKASLVVLVERNWIFASLGKMEEVRKGVQQGLEIQRTPDLLIQEAILKMGEKNLEEASAAAEEALRSAPEDIRALEILARSSAGKAGGAGLSKLRKYASDRPGSAPIQLFLGKWLQAQGDMSGAREALAAAKRAGSDSTDADLALAQLDLAETKWQDAREKITAIISRNQENVTAHYWLAQVEEILGNHSKSIEEYRKVVLSDPTNSLALNNLAVLLERAGQAGEALPIAQHAKELAPENAAVADTLGWALYHNGLYGMAVRQLEQACTLQPSALRVSHLSMAYWKAGSAVRARESLQRALKMDPDLPDVKKAQELLAATTEAK